jgi:nucleoside-diphosphate-sugar epimerase
VTSASGAPAAASLDLLVLGGTSWLGGAVARQALERGHRVTCLARGESGTPPEGVRWERADRREPAAYDAVADRHWDAVVEVSWQPAMVRDALRSLQDRIGHWVYVSSCSVYADDRTAGQAEDAPTHPPHPGDGPVDIEVYGPAKVACEQAGLQALGEERVMLARAGLIGGYGDRSDRLGYWPARVARSTGSDQVLVPRLSGPVQVVDVEDLAAWLVSAAEERIAGPYNAVGDQTTVGAVLEASASAAGRSPERVEAGDDWLTEQEVEPWAGPESLPLWLPGEEYAGFATRSNDAARRAGLRLRPLEETVRGALRWEAELGLDRERRAGLTAAREQDLLRRLSDEDNHPTPR